MKKHFFFIFLLQFVLTSWLLAQTENNESNNQEEQSQKVEPIVLKKTQPKYFVSILEDIKMPLRNSDLLLKLPLQRKNPSLKALISPLQFFFKEEQTFSFSPKIKSFSPFPLKAYLTLLEKTKTTVLSDVIAVSDKPITVIDGKKRVRVVVVFKTSEIDAQNDVESYAKVYLDKNQIGVTEQKLLSQPKVLEFDTTYEKHLLGLEIYIQDPYRKAWKRLKNIDQPAPKYFIPDPTKDTIYILVTYFPGVKAEKYKFESGYKE